MESVADALSPQSFYAEFPKFHLSVGGVNAVPFSKLCTNAEVYAISRANFIAEDIVLGNAVLRQGTPITRREKTIQSTRVNGARKGYLYLLYGTILLVFHRVDDDYFRLSVFTVEMNNSYNNIHLVKLDRITSYDRCKLEQYRKFSDKLIADETSNRARRELIARMKYDALNCDYPTTFSSPITDQFVEDCPELSILFKKAADVRITCSSPSQYALDMRYVNTGTGQYMFQGIAVSKLMALALCDEHIVGVSHGRQTYVVTANFLFVANKHNTLYPL